MIFIGFVCHFLHIHERWVNFLFSRASLSLLTNHYLNVQSCLGKEKCFRKTLMDCQNLKTSWTEMKYRVVKNMTFEYLIQFSLCGNILLFIFFYKNLWPWRGLDFIFLCSCKYNPIFSENIISAIKCFIVLFCWRPRGTQGGLLWFPIQLDIFRK